MLQIIIGFVIFKTVKILCLVVLKIILYKQFNVNEINFKKKESS